MTKIKINKLFFTLICSFFALSTFAQDVNIKSNKISKDSILIGDQVIWTTVLEVPQDKKIIVEPYNESIVNDSVKIDLLHDIKLDTLSAKNGIMEVEGKLLFTSFDSGYYKMPMPLFIINGTDTLQFDMPAIAVNTIQVDTTGFEMYDIKGQINYPVKFNEVFPWVLLVIVIIVIAYLIYRYIRYKRENRDFFGKPVVIDPPHIVALRELDKLRSQKMWQGGKEKQFYTQVADTLRLYLEGRYKISAMEKTSAEIMNELKENKIDAGSYNELNVLFNLADLVKFAKYSPEESENENVVPTAVKFVNTTFMKQMEEEK